MESWGKIAVGLAFLFFSLGYMYRPGLILRMHAWGRKILFDDAFVLHYRRRAGLFLFVCAVLFFYSGFVNLSHRQPGAAGYLALADAHRAFRSGEYRASVARCQALLKQEPDNVHAWILLGSAWSALGREKQAENAWAEALKIDPRCIVEINNHPPQLGPQGDAGHS